jgi:four helix bundle protein
MAAVSRTYIGSTEFSEGNGFVDYWTRSQFVDAVQSVSANVAEGYGRRTLPEHLQSLYTAKGSLAEAMTRACGPWRANVLDNIQFENFDQLHYEVENKLLALISSLEGNACTNWQIKLPPRHKHINPSLLIH